MCDASRELATATTKRSLSLSNHASSPIQSSRPHCCVSVASRRLCLFTAVHQKINFGVTSKTGLEIRELVELSQTVE